MDFVIVGTGRCGSTLIHHILASHPSVYVADESFYHIHLLHKYGDSAAPTQDILEDVARVRFHTGESPLALQVQSLGIPFADFLEEIAETVGSDEATAVRVMTLIEEAMLRYTGKRVFGDKTPHYGCHLKELRQFWPRLKTVHMVRDGVECAMSMSKHGGFQACAAMGVDDYVPVAPFGSSLRIDSPPAGLEVYMRMWARLRERICAELNALPASDALEIYYEALRAEPPATIKQVAEFLALDCPADWVESARKIVRPPRNPKPAAPRGGELGSALEQLARVGAERDDLAKELAAALEQSARVSAERDDLAKELAATLEQSARVGAERDDLAKELAAALEQSARVGAERDDLAKELAAALEQSARMGAERDDLAKELAAALEQSARVGAERDDLAKELAAALKQSARVGAERDDLAKELAAAGDQFSSKLEEENRERRALANSLEEAIATLKHADDMIAYMADRFAKISSASAERRIRRAESMRSSPPELQAIRNSVYFDKEYYLRENADVVEAGSDPSLHYLLYGAREGRDPGPFFSTARYVARYPDVAAAGVNPLAHYETHGRGEKRSVLEHSRC